VLLINGGRLMTGPAPDGRGAISDPPAARGGSLISPLIIQREGSVTEEIPGDAPPPRPDVPVHTLRVTGCDLFGKPDNGGTVWVFDAGDLTAFAASGRLHHGVVRFSVPTGRYWVIGDFESTADGAGLTHLVFLPQFAVAANTTVHVAERAADSEVTMATPRPGEMADVTFTAALGDRLGSTDSVEWFNAPGEIWVSPMARRPAAGTLRAYASAQLTSPADAAGTPYAYNLDYADPAGIIPAQHYRARPSALATVAERYYQDVPSTGAWTTFGAFPGEGLLGFTLGDLALPGRQVQYFSTAPDLLWSSGYSAFVPADGPPSGGQDDTFRLLHAGERQVVDWNRYPLHPQPDVSANGRVPPPFPLLPSAIRSGNTLTLTVTPFSDNQPGHLSGGSAAGTRVTVSYLIDEDGVQVSAGDAAGGVPPVTVSSRPSVITFRLDAERTGPSYLLSAGSQTIWTWRSRPRPHATVPPDWYCAYVRRRGVYVAVRTCAVQPMMTLGYQVQGLAPNGTTAPGQQLVGLHVGHIQLAAAAPVSRVAAEVSCGRGQAWHRADVRPEGGGNYRIGFSAPGGCRLTMRVSAADAAGDSITETIERAYGIR
jgi:hypothetical protein